MRLLCATLWLLATHAAAAEYETQRGPVRAIVSLTPDAPLIGDALTLEITAHAEPGVELIMPAFGEALDRFAIVEFVPRETLGSDGGTIATQRYTLQASRSGRLTVPPIAIEFVDRRPGQAPGPPGLDAYELLTERIQFEVGSVLPEGSALELRPAKGELGSRSAPSLPIWVWGVVAGGVLAALAPFALRAWLAARARARQKSAYEIAATALDGLLGDTRPGDDTAEMDRFFVRLSDIVRRYLEDRFRLRSPELTTEEFFEVMTRSPDLRTQHQSLLRTLLERADLVKFAHFVPDAPAVDESIESARRFVEETREEALVG